MGPARLFPLLWTAWVVSWFGAAWWSGATEKRAGMRREIGYRAVLFIGAILFGIPAHGHEGALRLWHVRRVEAWVCLAVTLGGFAFCWLGRVHLGRLWSGQITKKEGHRVVDTGPHGIVRHPIYTGILLAVFATIAAKGTAALRIAGGLLLATGLWMKARLEERWMRSELGGAYDAYRQRVPMLIPFSPRG